MERLRYFLRSKGALRLASIAVAGVLVAVSAELIRNWIAGAASNSSLLLGLLTVTVLLLILSQQVILRDEFKNLADRARFSVRYFSAETDAEIEELHRQAMSVIKRAPKGAEVSAVNSYVEVYRKPSDSIRSNAASRDYLREYERRFGEISYRRLIQVAQPRLNGHFPDLAELLNEAYLDHYRKMAEYSGTNRNAAIQLAEVRAVVPISFVVVKYGSGGEIIWQIHRHSPSSVASDAQTMLGILIIRDPDGQLVPTFLQWFSQIDRGSRHEITADELRLSKELNRVAEGVENVRLRKDDTSAPGLD